MRSATVSPAPAEEAARTVLAALRRIAPAGRIGVGVSGGGDSVALLAMLAEAGVAVEAATVDHRLRPASAVEAEGVAALCGRLGVPHETLVWEGEARGNLPEAARRARHALLGRWAWRRGLAGVALGHTLDDQAETVLMRLARGSGVDGLSAMAERTEIAGTLWLRPMLAVRREALRDWLRAREIGWVEDPTNDDPAHDRVKARRALAALGPLGVTVEGLAATADRLRRQRAVLDAACDMIWARAVVPDPAGWLTLDAAAMGGASEEIALRLLSRVLVAVSGADHRPERASVLRLRDALAAPGFRGATLSGCVLAPCKAGVSVMREPARVAPPAPLEDGGIWDGRWRIAASGAWPAGTEIGALGEDGVAALRRAVADGSWTPPETWTATPRAARLTVPAVRAGGNLLAVPAAGFAAFPGARIATEWLGAPETRQPGVASAAPAT